MIATVTPAWSIPQSVLPETGDAASGGEHQGQRESGVPGQHHQGSEELVP